MPSKQVVLITGASRGIGLIIACFLLQGSHSIPASRVVTLSRSHPAALQELEIKHPEDLLCVQGDVTNEEDNVRAVQAATRRLGRLDSVILNAGDIAFAQLGDFSAEEFHRIVPVNLISLHLTLRAALPFLRQSPSGTGKVVLLSTNAGGPLCPAGFGAYSISKAGANVLIRTLAKEERGSASTGDAPGRCAVACFALQPDSMNTEMQATVRREAGPHVDPAMYERLVGLHTNGQLRRPELPGHVAAALATLGTRTEPKSLREADQGKGFGELGAFFNWDDAELKDEKWQEAA